MTQQDLIREGNAQIPGPVLPHAVLCRTPRFLPRDPPRAVRWCRPRQDFRPLGSSLERSRIRKWDRGINFWKVERLSVDSVKCSRTSRIVQKKVRLELYKAPTNATQILQGRGERRAPVRLLLHRGGELVGVVPRRLHRV